MRNLSLSLCLNENQHNSLFILLSFLVLKLFKCDQCDCDGGTVELVKSAEFLSGLRKTFISRWHFPGHILSDRTLDHVQVEGVT